MKKELVLMVTLGSLSKFPERVVRTLVGQVGDTPSPFLSNSQVRWYADLSEGDMRFRSIDEQSTLAEQIDRLGEWAQTTWSAETYSILYHLTDEEEAREVIDAYDKRGRGFLD